MNDRPPPAAEFLNDPSTNPSNPTIHNGRLSIADVVDNQARNRSIPYLVPYSAASIYKSENGKASAKSRARATNNEARVSIEAEKEPKSQLTA